MLEEIRGYLGAGYRRVKLKIEPGRDVDVVRDVREAVGPDVPLSVDANAAYTLDDVEVLPPRARRFGLVMIEQPLESRGPGDRARLAREIRAPICWTSRSVRLTMPSSRSRWARAA